MPEFVYQNPYAGQDVFILGAGFSKAISEKMPLLSELTRPVLDRIEGEEYGTIPYLHSDIELALTFLSQWQPWLSESDYLRNRALALQIAQAIAAEVAEKSAAVRAEPIPGWLVRFVHWLHARQAVVITLNYDTLLEAAFSMIETDAPHLRLAPQFLISGSVRCRRLFAAHTCAHGRTPETSRIHELAVLGPPVILRRTASLPVGVWVGSQR